MFKAAKGIQMKSLLFLLLISTSQLAGQPRPFLNSLTGVWMSADAFLSFDRDGGWGDTYQFFSDGKFIFNPNQRAVNQYMVSVKGSYSHTADTLVLIAARAQFETSKRITHGGLHEGWRITREDPRWYSNSPPDTSVLRLIMSPTWEGPETTVIFGTAEYVQMSKDPRSYP